MPETNEVEKNGPTPVVEETKVEKTSFVTPQQNNQEKDKKIGIPELLVKILDTEMYIGSQLKESNDTLQKILSQLSKVPAQPTVSQPVTSVPTSPSSSTADDAKLIKIKETLNEFADKINIDANENTMFYIVKIKSFLGTENFAKLAGKVRELGGEYVSKGKESHFKISKKP